MHDVTHLMALDTHAAFLSRRYRAMAVTITHDAAK